MFTKITPLRLWSIFVCQRIVCFCVPEIPEEWSIYIEYIHNHKNHTLAFVELFLYAGVLCVFVYPKFHRSGVYTSSQK